MKIVFILVITLSLWAKSVEFLDAKVLDNPTIEGLKFTEISDLSYDKTQDLFYAVSDRGRVFKIKIDIKNNKITDINYKNSYRLRGKNGYFLPKRRRDSEGLAIVGDKIFISFERRDRIDVYDKNLRYIRRLKLPEDLDAMAMVDYSGDGFEALTYSKKWGYITAREVPFDQEVSGYHTIFGKNGAICRFKRDKKKSALTELEMMEDGNILVLLRKFSLKKFTFSVKLKIIDLKNIKNSICKTKKLITLTPLNDRYIDNYEGLTHYKDNLYLMISDDNDNLFQRTILRLFRIKDDK